MPEVSYRPLAHSPEDIRPLHRLCREGRLYDVERWIADGKLLQLTPEAVRKGTRPKTALQIAIETGQHSLAPTGNTSSGRLGRPWDVAEAYFRMMESAHLRLLGKSVLFTGEESNLIFTKSLHQSQSIWLAQQSPNNFLGVCMNS
jgi:hypothetical protein